MTSEAPYMNYVQPVEPEEETPASSPDQVFQFNKTPVNSPVRTYAKGDIIFDRARTRETLERIETKLAKIELLRRNPRNKWKTKKRDQSPPPEWNRELTAWSPNCSKHTRNPCEEKLNHKKAKSNKRNPKPKSREHSSCSHRTELRILSQRRFHTTQK